MSVWSAASGGAPAVATLVLLARGSGASHRASFTVRGSAMLPALADGTRIQVDTARRSPRRGDVIVFHQQRLPLLGTDHGAKIIGTAILRAK